MLPWIRSGESSPGALSFDSAFHGEHAIGHPPGVCDLCDLYYRARESVIRVRTSRGQGAGLVVSAAGGIVTNAHVVAGHDTLTIETHDGREYTAGVRRADPRSDLALLRMHRAAGCWRAMAMKRGPLPRIGTDVYVIGHPGGLGWSVSRGIVSGTRRTGEVGDFAMIQTDAAISPGNSGGPLLDRDGNFLGLVVAKLSGRGIENIAFAIPASRVAAFIADPTGSTDARRAGPGGCPRPSRRNAGAAGRNSRTAAGPE